MSNRETKITTILDLKKYIKIAKIVLVQIRFGNNEKWIKLSKTEALNFISTCYSDIDTPDDCEMYEGVFGDFEDGILYMG